MTQELSNLSDQLRELHQELLQFQNQKPDENAKPKSKKGESWLDPLSDLIHRIDEKLQSQEEIEILDVQLIHDQASHLFASENPDFQTPFQIALNTDPRIAKKQDQVRSSLHQLQPWVKNMHEMHNENEKNRHQNSQ